jgi:hypothetical protein
VGSRRVHAWRGWSVVAFGSDDVEVGVQVEFQLGAIVLDDFDVVAAVFVDFNADDGSSTGLGEGSVVGTRKVDVLDVDVAVVVVVVVGTGADDDEVEVEIDRRRGRFRR